MSNVNYVTFTIVVVLFLIVTLANLAMPGSSNFIGEFMILLGAFNSHIVIAVIASIAVIGAAFYALRLFIGAMHNRVGRGVRSREIGRTEAIAIVPLVAIILVLAFYPQFGLNKSEASLKVAIYPAAALGSTAPYALPGATTAAARWKSRSLSETAYASASTATRAATPAGAANATPVATATSTRTTGHR